MFDELVGRVSGVGGGRAMDGVALLLSIWLLCSENFGWRCPLGLCVL